MNKKTVIYLNIILFILASLVVLNCNSKPKGKKEVGYVKETDTLFKENSNTVKAVYRTFFRKQPTINNGLLEFKQPQGETYVTVVIMDKDSDDFSLIVIEDFKEFLEKTKVVVNHRNKDYTVSIDDLETTYMRKSLSFDNGVFIRKEANNTPATLFDLSEQSLKELEIAYNSFIKE